MHQIGEIQKFSNWFSIEILIAVNWKIGKLLSNRFWIPTFPPINIQVPSQSDYSRKTFIFEPFLSIFSTRSPEHSPPCSPLIRRQRPATLYVKHSPRNSHVTPIKKISIPTVRFCRFLSGSYVLLKIQKSEFQTKLNISP